MDKKRKNLSLYESEIVLGNKICNLRDRNFSAMVGELIKEEAIRNELSVKKINNQESYTANMNIVALIILVIKNN
jgi:hypothetical protein